MQNQTKKQVIGIFSQKEDHTRIKFKCFPRLDNDISNHYMEFKYIQLPPKLGNKKREKSPLSLLTYDFIKRLTYPEIPANHIEFFQTIQLAVRLQSHSNSNRLHFYKPPFD